MPERVARVRELGLETRPHSRTLEDVDTFTKEAVDAYVSVMLNALQSMDAPRLMGVLLYGSRARGDHRDESDADLALVLKGHEFGSALRILEDLDEKTYLVEAKYGFMVSPTIIWAALLDTPALSSNPAFYRNILAEGISWNIE